MREGIKPVIMPTREEYEATKKCLQYEDGIFHFAIAGISGSGKSSLINAFRGLHNGSRGSLVAKTGVTETTSQIARYADPNKANPFVWYDVPGAGTLIPDWVYFNQQDRRGDPSKLRAIPDTLVHRALKIFATHTERPGRHAI